MSEPSQISGGNSSQALTPQGQRQAAPRGFLRLLLAYRVTFVVIASYYFLRFRLRFASDERALRLLTDTHLRNARRILLGIEVLQGLFIKVGQLISILSNVLPEEFRSELTTLQDRVPPRPYADVEKRFREEFGGRGPLQVFAQFSQTPVASASIGQVHRARTFSGIDVAVKVQYPDINEIVRLDLRALGRIFSILHWLAPQHGMQAVFAEIRDMILAELDFELEAKNSQRIAENFTASSASSLRLDGERASPLAVAFPEVFRDFSTSRVLTTRWVDGIKVSNLARLDRLGIDRTALARTVVTAYCQQIFRDGIYHADPHPGNLLVLPAKRETSDASDASDGSATLVFLDFGAVAELSPRMRRGIVETLQAALTRDTPRLVSAMKDMGFIARGADPDIFERVVDFFHDKLQAEVKLDSFSLSDVRLKPEMKFEVLSDLRRLNVSLRDLLQHFHVPKEWILLERTLLLLLGLCTELDPKLEPMQVIRPYISEFVLGKDRDLSRLLVETTRDVLGTALALPGDLRRFLSRAQRGQLELRFRDVDEGARLLYTLGHQIIYAACGIAAFVASIIWEGRGEFERADFALYTCGGFGVFLLWSMLTTRARSRSRR
jgi:predicted unusual protein kinase regulating ubiquinone biosynthesis (AarF/ABC1/UbiB family)